MIANASRVALDADGGAGESMGREQMSISITVIAQTHILRVHPACMLKVLMNS
jgi:hypothetical protein